MTDYQSDMQRLRAVLGGVRPDEMTPDDALEAAIGRAEVALLRLETRRLNAALDRFEGTAPAQERTH